MAVPCRYRSIQVRTWPRAPCRHPVQYRDDCGRVPQACLTTHHPASSSREATLRASATIIELSDPSHSDPFGIRLLIFGTNWRRFLLRGNAFEVGLLDPVEMGGGLAGVGLGDPPALQHADAIDGGHAARLGRREQVTA